MRAVRSLLPLLLALGTVLFLPHALAVRPLWLLVTALHEASHGLAAVLLGGRITSFHVNADAGGWCGYVIEPTFLRTLLVAGAGYTGSLLAGLAMVAAAAWTRRDRWFLAILGGVLLALAWLCLSSLSLFGTLFCAGTGLGFLVLSRLPLGALHDFLLRLTGGFCAFLSVADLKDDLVDRTVAQSDGSAIARALHLPAAAVGWGWLVLALALLAAGLWLSFRLERGNGER